MAMVKLLLGAASAGIAALGVHAPGVAQQTAARTNAEIPSVETRERDTNNALLEALLLRRDEVARSVANPENRRYALDFLDRQIAQVRLRLAQ